MVTCPTCGHTHCEHCGRDEHVCLCLDDAHAPSFRADTDPFNVRVKEIRKIGKALLEEYEKARSGMLEADVTAMTFALAMLERQALLAVFDHP